jgi:hypothetical protein
MPCDTRLKPKQTIQDRAAEVRRMVALLAAKLTSGQAKLVVGKDGAVAFSGLTDQERDGVTDACAYRRLMISGSALVKAKIAAAEQLAGRGVSLQTLANGMHSHDGGKTWHHGH